MRQLNQAMPSNVIALRPKKERPVESMALQIALQAVAGMGRIEPVAPPAVVIWLPIGRQHFPSPGGRGRPSRRPG